MTMQEAIKNQELANLDLTKVAALQQKRTLAFVNHFVVTTVQFLNNFSKKCEVKLMNFERKLEKVEAALILLETRLSSIPEVSSNISIEPKEVITTELPVTQSTEETTKSPQDLPSEDNPSSNESAKPNPEYDRFVKMVNVGVPLEAVKLKVTIEGLDPGVLEKFIKK